MARLVVWMAMWVIGSALAASTAEAALSASQVTLKRKLTPDARFSLDGVTFTGTTTTLQPASNKVLLDLAAVVKAHPETRLILEVFVDPTDPNAQTLSEKRAEILGARLRGFGAPAGTVEVKGLGGTEVLVPSIVEAMKMKNRRVMVRVVVAPSAAAPIRTPVVVATPAPAPTPLPIATRDEPGARGARVTLVATRTTPRDSAANTSGALRRAGVDLVRLAHVMETRPTTTIYFTPAFEGEAKRLASNALPAATRLVGVGRIDARTDLLVVLGSEAIR